MGVLTDHRSLITRSQIAKDAAFKKINGPFIDTAAKLHYPSTKRWSQTMRWCHQRRNIVNCLSDAEMATIAAQVLVPRCVLCCFLYGVLLKWVVLVEKLAAKRLLHG